MKACCGKFAIATSKVLSSSGLGSGYPPSVRPKAQIECDDKGTWNVNGCCGGGCYVLTEITHCAFCGAALPRGEKR